jgi:uncharacterized membrane protein YwzB
MKNKNYNKTFNKLKKMKFFIVVLSFFITTKLHAQSLENPLGTTSVPQLIGIVINALLGIVGSLSLIMFIYGGFLWIMSGGNEDNVKKGKETLKWAVMGIVVVFASYGILNFILDMLS